MAFPVEDLAAEVAEGVAGPWGVVLGLGALGLLVASRGRSATLRPSSLDHARSPAPAVRSGWLGRLREDWRPLVAEARREHAGRSPRRLAHEVAMSENGAASARGHDGRGRLMTRSANGTSAG